MIYFRTNNHGRGPCLGLERIVEGNFFKKLAREVCEQPLALVMFGVKEQDAVLVESSSLLFAARSLETRSHRKKRKFK